MSKYDPLRVFLEDVTKDVSEITLTFEQIDTVLDSPLPPSARRHRAWWSNPSTPHDIPHAQAWLAAGWEVDTVDQDSEWVRFRRMISDHRKVEVGEMEIKAEKDKQTEFAQLFEEFSETYPHTLEGQGHTEMYERGRAQGRRNF